MTSAWPRPPPRPLVVRGVGTGVLAVTLGAKLDMGKGPAPGQPPRSAGFAEAPLPRPRRRPRGANGQGFEVRGAASATARNGVATSHEPAGEIRVVEHHWVSDALSCPSHLLGG